MLIAAALALGLPSESTTWPPLLSALSPFIALGSVLATRTLHAWVWLGLISALAAMARPRFICRWICPTGLVLDGVGWAGRRCGRQPSRSRPLGRWLLFATLGGALVGLPLFLWLDPLALFTAARSIPGSDWKASAVYASVLLLTLIVLNFGWPGIWCKQLCPLGALQSLAFSSSNRIRRRLRPAVPFRSETLGQLGAEREPSLIANQRNSPFLSRRSWLTVAGGAAVGAALPRMPTAFEERPLRPPGAVDDPGFNGVCVRCGNCARVCPSGVIHNSSPRQGWLRSVSPILSFETDYCREDCVRCGEVCPSGALRRIRQDQKSDLRIGHPRIRLSACLLTDERECSHCRNWCPYGAISYRFNHELYTLEPRVDSDRCNGCGACEAHCPATPVKAITIESV